MHWKHQDSWEEHQDISGAPRALGMVGALECTRNFGMHQEHGEPWEQGFTGSAGMH